MTGNIEDDRFRTIDCLRGRLLVERVASEAAKKESENLAKRLEALERKLDEETKCRKRAEKRLQHALKKLETLKVLDVGSQLVLPDSSASSLSSQTCFLGHASLEGEHSGSPTVNAGLCSSLEVAKEMPRSISSEEVLGDDISSTDSSSACLHHQSMNQDKGNWLSVRTESS